MAKPLFVVGMQRNGTTILTRLLCMQCDCGRAPRGYEPFARWDIPAVAELGGDCTRTPLIDGIRKYVDECPDQWAVVRLALPWAWESLGWHRLLDLFPDAKIVLIWRTVEDAMSSWMGLPYVKTLNVDSFASGVGTQSTEVLKASYRFWAWSIFRSFGYYRAAAEDRMRLVNYEDLVVDADKALDPVWDLLQTWKMSGLQKYIVTPKHWSGGSQ